MSTDSLQPLVSCVMPTAGRRKWVPQAIHYFQKQDYPHRELIILDDGLEPVEDLIPPDPRIRYRHLDGRRTLGAKRNLCVAESRGDLIMHWDDDDWMASYRIRYQVEALVGTKADVCGLPRILYYDLMTDRVWLYQYPQQNGPWLAGGSLLYTKEFWSRAPFRDIQVASDTSFVWSQSLEGAVFLDDYKFYVAMIHPGNTSPKYVEDPCWQPWPGDIRQIIGKDLDSFRSLVKDSGRISSPVLPDSHGNCRPIGGVVPVEFQARYSHQETVRLRIGYVLSVFSPLSETSIRREILALCELGHHVFVYTPKLARDSMVEVPDLENLTVRKVDCSRSLQPLAEAVWGDGIEHLHGGLMLWAQQTTHHVAEALQIPFTISACSGISIFTTRDIETYGRLSRSPWCRGVVAEDPFMHEWLASRRGVDPTKIVIIPNPLDLDLFRLPEPRPVESKTRILAVARFVERKGLIHLIEAFKVLSARRDDVELCMVGGGPEEDRLRLAARGNRLITFQGFLSEEQCRQFYAAADIFCLPCMRLADGDADGMPTAVLEAMAFELPVVTSDLLSIPHYIRHGHEGLLAPPGDSAAVADCLDRLCSDPGLRVSMGRKGRSRVEELCVMDRNIARLNGLFVGSRVQQKQQGMLFRADKQNGFFRDGVNTLDKRLASRKDTDKLTFTQSTPSEDDGFPGLIDVVIPHYNCSDHLPRSLSSLANQSYNCIRVTIVDDGSDNPHEVQKIISGFQDRLLINFLAHEKNRGAPAARNTGAAKAIGEYLFFLDADCFMFPYAFQRLLETLIAAPSASFAYCGFVWGDKTIKGEPYDETVLLSRNFISTMSLIRREAFPGFDESLKRLQDWDLWITMMKQDKVGQWTGEVLFETPMRENSITTGSYTWEEAAAVLRQKHKL